MPSQKPRTKTPRHVMSGRGEVLPDTDNPRGHGNLGFATLGYNTIIDDNNKDRVLSCCYAMR